MTALNFPNSPAIGDTWPNPPVTGIPTYKWDGADWLSNFALGKPMVPLDGSTAMTGLLTLSGDPTAVLNAATKQYVDAGDAAGTVAALHKNYVINGAMMVSQENGTAAGTATTYYPVDMFRLGSTNAGAPTIQQVASVTPSGSPNRIRVTTTAAHTTVSAGDFLRIVTPIEGLRVTDLKIGTTNASQIVVQFGVKAPAGTYCISLENGVSNRTYVGEYVVAAGEANIDVVKSVALTLDKIGTWASDNTVGLYLGFALMSGSTYQTPAGVWTAGDFIASPNQFNFAGAAGNTFELFDVSLTKGATAPPFQVPDYVNELASCQRYYAKSFAIGVNPANNVEARDYNCTCFSAGTLISHHIPYPVRMRAVPTMTFWQPSGVTGVAYLWSWFSSAAWAAATGSMTLNAGNDTGFAVSFSVSGGTAGSSYLVQGSWSANARL